MISFNTGGKVRMTPKGIHNPINTYTVLDLVSNTEQNIYYIAKQDVPTDVPITDTTYWAVVTDMSECLSDFLESIAPNYEDMIYPITQGTLTVYAKKLYIANMDINTFEEWNSNHWNETTIGNELASTVPIKYGSAEGSVQTKSFTRNNNIIVQMASGIGSFAEGYNTVASGLASHAEGDSTNALGADSHTEGANTIASSTSAHAEGNSTLATGVATHSEGLGTKAIGSGSHSEGGTSIANGNYSHAENYYTVAYGANSHAENKGEWYTLTVTGEAESTTYTYSSTYSYNGDPAIGDIVCRQQYCSRITAVDSVNKTFTVDTTLHYQLSSQGLIFYCSGAFGENSHVEGKGTIALGPEQHVQGRYNIADADDTYAEIVGNGTTHNSRSNARTLDWLGNEELAGSLTLGKDTEAEVTITAEEYAQLRDNVDEHYGGGVVSFALESGSISSASGEEYNRTDRIRTVDYIDLSEYEGNVTIPENHAIIPVYYNSSKVWQNTGEWLTECSVSDFDNYPYIRFVLRNNQHMSDDISDEVGTIMFGMNLKNKSNAQLYEDVKSIYNSISLLNAPLEIHGLVQVARLGWEVYSSSTPPEQSIPSYCLAYKNGCRVMLADVQVTEDGKYVCFHDLTLGNDTGTSNCVRHTDGTQLTNEEKALYIYDLTLAELDEFDFGIKKGSQYAGTKILRLEDFLKWCKVMGCTAMLETKINFTAAQAEEIANMVIKYGLDKNIIWAENAYQSSWGGRTIPVITQMLPNAIIHIRGGSNNYQNALAFAQQYATAAKHTELSFTNVNNLTDEVIDLLHSNNIDVAFSEIKSVSELNEMVESGLIYKIKSVACSYVNIGQYFVNKYLE